MADYKVYNEGTIFLFRPLNEAAQKNLEEHVAEDALWFSGALAVEHRYAAPLAVQLASEGWVVE